MTRGDRPPGGEATLTSSTIAAGRAAAFLKLLAHEGRLEIMCQLIDGEKTVGELSKALGESQPAVSQQLMRLRAEGFVTCRRSGREIRYSNARQEVETVVRTLQRVFCPPQKHAND